MASAVCVGLTFLGVVAERPARSRFPGVGLELVTVSSPTAPRQQILTTLHPAFHL